MKTARDISSVAVLGGRGMLGTDLTRYLQHRNYNALALDLPECDITRRDQLVNAISRSDAVVNCAAFTDVDGAEDAQGPAMAVNADAVGRLGEIAVERDVFVVHISTDFVFDGYADAPYSEQDTPCPLNVYGRTKLMGEKKLEQAGCEYSIMRVQWSYGRNGTNFISKLLDRAQDGADIRVVDDQVGAPTWTMDMAQAVECILRGRHSGLYHFANAGYTSRFEAASFMIRAMGLRNRVVPCSSSDFPAKAVRPLNSRFDTTRIRAILDHPIRHWHDALLEFIRQA